MSITRWEQWLPSLVSAALVVGALGSFAISNEARISTLEVQMRAMESGRSTPMAESTRERFNSVEAQIIGVREAIERLEARVERLADQWHKLQGIEREPKRGGNTGRLPLGAEELLGQKPPAPKPG